MLMPTVNYLRVIDCEPDAANRNESYRKDHKNGKEAYESLPIYQSIKKNFKDNSTSTDATFGGAWYNRVVAKQENSHSTVQQINK